MTEWEIKLQDLKQRIEQDFGAANVFFFPSVPKRRIAGYWGNGPVVFVAERPSRAPAKRRQATRLFSSRFEQVLTRHHFEDAHLTDLIKHFPGTGVRHSELVDRNWPYFLEELAIVDAKLVVSVGSVVRDILKRRLEYPLMHVPHYAYRYGPTAELRQHLDSAFQRVREAAGALTAGPT